MESSVPSTHRQHRTYYGDEGDDYTLPAATERRRRPPTFHRATFNVDDILPKQVENFSLPVKGDEFRRRDYRSVRDIRDISPSGYGGYEYLDRPVESAFRPRRERRSSPRPTRRTGMLEEGDLDEDDSDSEYPDYDKAGEPGRNITINLNIGENEKDRAGRSETYRKYSTDNSRTSRSGRPTRTLRGRHRPSDWEEVRTRSVTRDPERRRTPRDLSPVIINHHRSPSPVLRRSRSYIRYPEHSFASDLVENITAGVIQNLSDAGVYDRPRGPGHPPPPPPPRPWVHHGRPSEMYQRNAPTPSHVSFDASFPSRGNSSANELKFGPRRYGSRRAEPTDNASSERFRGSSDEASDKLELGRSNIRDRSDIFKPHVRRHHGETVRVRSRTSQIPDLANVPAELRPYLHPGEKAWTFLKDDQKALATEVPLEIGGKPVVVPLPSIDRHLVIGEDVYDPHPGERVDPCKGITEDVAGKILEYFPFAEGFCAFVDGTLQLLAPDLSLENITKLPAKFMGMRLSISQCVGVPSSDSIDGLPDLEPAGPSAAVESSNASSKESSLPSNTDDVVRSSTNPTSVNSDFKVELDEDEQEDHIAGMKEPSQSTGDGRNAALILYGNSVPYRIPQVGGPIQQKPKRMNKHGRIVFHGVHQKPGGVVSTTGLLMKSPNDESHLVASCHAAHESVGGLRLSNWSFGALHRWCRHQRANRPVNIIGATAYDADDHTLIGTISQTFDENPLPANPPFPDSFPTDICLVSTHSAPPSYLADYSQRLTWYEHTLSTLSNIPPNSRVRIFGDDHIAMTVGTFVSRRNALSGRKSSPPRDGDVNPRIETVNGATTTLTKSLWDRSILYRRLNAPSSIEPLSGAPVVAQDRSGGWTCLVGFQSLQFIRRCQAVEDALDTVELRRRLARGECSLWGARFPPRELVEGGWELFSKKF